MDSHKKMSDGLLDAAACEALGATPSAESAAYQQELAAAGEDARRTDRDLRETVARLAAASPHMPPPPDLRGRILQATAPTTFRMEDYRKATRDDGRLHRWGFYAAALALMAGVSYTVSLHGALKKANTQVASLHRQVEQKNSALVQFVNPNAQQITLVDKETGKAYGKALADEKTRQAVVILPPEMVPDGKTARFTRDGVAYETVLVTAPGNTLDAPRQRTLEMALKVENVGPDESIKPVVAKQ
jgi:hypothetical protein